MLCATNIRGGASRRGAVGRSAYPLSEFGALLSIVGLRSRIITNTADITVIICRFFEGIPHFRKKLFSFVVIHVVETVVEDVCDAVEFLVVFDGGKEDVAVFVNLAAENDIFSVLL